MEFTQFACECCGEEQLTEDMKTRLILLQEGHHEPMPAVANGFHCEKKAHANPHGDSGPHAEGKAVSFETANQYARHSFLRVALQTFAQVWIYPNRVTLISDYDGSPFVITPL